MKRHLANIAFMATALSVALGSYLVSARVAAERAAVEGLKGAIQADMEDIRGLEAELRIRARLPQLERWNSEVLALQAPQAGQFARDALHLAALAQPLQPEAAQPSIASGGPVRPDVRGAAVTDLAGTAGDGAGAVSAASAPVIARAQSAAPLPAALPRAPRSQATSLVAVAMVAGGHDSGPAGLASAGPAMVPAAATPSDLGLSIASELARLPAPVVPAGQ